MVDHYYNHEDDLTAPEVELENIQAQEHALSTIVADTAAHVNRIVEIGAWLANRQQDADDQAFVNEMVTLANTMGIGITQQDIAHKGAATFARRMFELHHQLAGDMEAICREMDKVEFDLLDAKHDINKLEGDLKETLKTAVEEMFAQLHKGIRKATGCKEWAAVYRLTDVFSGTVEASDEQRELMSRLIETVIQPEQE